LDLEALSITSSLDPWRDKGAVYQYDGKASLALAPVLEGLLQVVASKKLQFFRVIAIQFSYGLMTPKNACEVLADA
jgi:hypothetical protein